MVGKSGFLTNAHEGKATVLSNFLKGGNKNVGACSVVSVNISNNYWQNKL